MQSAKRNGKNGNSNDLARRIEKLEGAYNLALEMLEQKSVTLLVNSDLPDPLRKLLRELMHGTISASDVPRLCNLLRSRECDLTISPAVKLAIGMLLLAVELGHSVRKPR